MFPKLQNILAPGFVEARLHTDIPGSHPRAGFDPRIQEVRAHFLGEGNTGLPNYVIVSPDHPLVPLATKFDGGKGGLEAFRAFLESTPTKVGG